MAMRDSGEKGTGPICRNGPKGASHKLDLSPFPRRIVQVHPGERRPQLIHVARAGHARVFVLFVLQHDVAAVAGVGEDLGQAAKVGGLPPCRPARRSTTLICDVDRVGGELGQVAVDVVRRGSCRCRG